MHLNTRVIFTLYTIYGTLFKGECRVRERVRSICGVCARASRGQCQKVAGARGDHACPGGMRRAPLPPPGISPLILACTCPRVIARHALHPTSVDVELKKGWTEPARVVVGCLGVCV